MKAWKGKKHNTVIKKFGFWVVTRNWILWTTSPYEYTIHKKTLWDTREDGEDILWDWPIHLAEKIWVTELALHQFNQALFYAQNHFKELRPAFLDSVSIEEIWKNTRQYLNKRR